MKGVETPDIEAMSVSYVFIELGANQVLFSLRFAFNSGLLGAHVCQVENVARLLILF